MSKVELKVLAKEGAVIPEYKTAGYGMLEQTNPLLLTSLGIQRDSSKKLSNILAEKTMEIINNESL